MSEQTCHAPVRRTGRTALTAAPNRRRWWVLAVVLAAQFMFVVDAFIVNVALPAIRDSLHAGSGEMEAVVAAYQIAYATTVITGGRLGDVFGRRRVFIAGVLCFTAASLWCGLATSGLELAIARLAQGASAALMIPQVLAAIHVLFPDAARSQAFAVFGVTLGVGGAAGVALGGWLVTLNLAGLGWRSVFLVNLPVGAAIAAAAWVLLPRADRGPGVRLDLAGTGLLFVALAALIGPILAGRDLGWPWWLFGVMAVGDLLLVAFLAMERQIDRRGGSPLIPSTLLSDRRFLIGLATVAALQFGNLSFYLTVTLYLQDRLGFPAWMAGTAVVPVALAFTLASRLAGGWLPRFGLRVLRIGTLLQLFVLLDLAALAFWWPVPPRMVLIDLLAVFGFGQGLVMAPLPGLVLASVPAGQAGAASGVLNTVHQAAGAVGVSLVGAIWFEVDPVAAWGLLSMAALATFGLIGRMRREQARKPAAAAMPQLRRYFTQSE